MPSLSVAAVAYGKLRYLQGYTPAMLVDESRIMEVTIFGMLPSKRHSLDVTLLLPDVMAIADEVDAQLTQSIGCYSETHEGLDSCVTHRKANTHFKDNK